MKNTSNPDTDNLEMMRYRDFEERKIWNNRMSLRRAMLRPDDPFPPPIRIGPNTLVWFRHQVEAWVSRQAQRDTKGVA